jgi:hypothetical protein
MKKVIIMGLFVATLFSCTNPQQAANKSSEAIEFIYEPTYQSSFEMGSDEKVLLIQEMHQHIIDQDYDKAVSYLTDNVVFSLDNGTSLEGKESVLQFMKEAYSSVSINDYSVAVNFTVIAENGDEWVLLWDNGTIESADGAKASYSWMEAFAFTGDKVSYLNQYAKPILPTE